MKRKKLEKKSFLKAVIALAVALAFVMPGAAAFANIGTIGVTSNSENTGDMENIVEISTNSDTSDNTLLLTLGTIYVDDDADPSWYDATHVKTIQEGINNASVSDTVYVYNGTYYENVLVNKTVDLIGESRENVIVDSSGSGDVVKVTVSDVSVDSFTTTNGMVGIWVLYPTTDFEHINITNCISHDNQYHGIFTMGGYYMRNSVIKNCEVYNNMNGMDLSRLETCTISECYIHDNDRGISFLGSSLDNRIYHNNFIGNTLNAHPLNAAPGAIWDNGYPSGGNYWDDYTGSDADGDGIGDTSYILDADERDNYPLMNPWGTHPEITDVTATPESQSVGGNVNITCTVEDNNGVKQAIAYVTDPSGYQQGFEMTGINVDYLGNGEYYYNATYSMFGMYSYFIRAENWRDCGNESDVYQFEIEGSDTVPPVTNCTLMGTVGENDWYVSDVEVNLTVTDPPPSSGINYTTYKLDENNWTEYMNPFMVTTDGPHTVEYNSTDNAGNIEPTKSMDFKIDKTDPVTTHSLSGTMGNNGWYTSNVVVTLTASDVTSEINYTMYNLNGTGWTEYTVSITVTTDGYHTVEYNSTDNASNTEPTKSMDFKIDKTAPETSCELDPPEPDGENDWYVSDVEAKLTATDDTSEINYTMYNLDGTGWTEYGSITVTTDGTHTVKYNSTDNAGNTESTKSMDFKIDKTDPTIKLTWEDDSKLVADVFDETSGSGVAKVNFYVNDKLVGTATEYPYEWIVSDPESGDTGYAIVYDNAGNEARSEDVKSQSHSQSHSESYGENTKAITYDNAGNSAGDEKPVNYNILNRFQMLIQTIRARIIKILSYFLE